jgi:CubicO group peptidase (beta-lactamase class C family)
MGGLPKGFAARLERMTADEAPKRSPGLQVGGRLLREWNGVTHVIDVTGHGFRWRNSTYRSLSAIAREITGAHWSGPRFFGLAGKTGR